jgi:acetolactate synthase I/II/III large subunit
MKLRSNVVTGAESLVETLVASDVRVCFANPGTSEMHFVSALDRVEGMRCVLALFEGVATGAADGYFRMTGIPAATLLHLGPGLANGLANLHNARKARSGIVNIVGQHATYHLALDAPLTSDVEAVARPFSDWLRVCSDSEEVARAAAAAVTAARTAPGQIATLILPADAAWGSGSTRPTAAEMPRSQELNVKSVDAAARALRRGARSALLLGGAALRGRALEFAGRIAAKTGCQLLCENLNARVERGAGRVPVARIPYVVDAACKMLHAYDHVVLAGAKPPVAFFAYPDKPSTLTREDAEIVEFANAADDVAGSLELLADALGARVTAAHVAPAADRARPSGSATPESIGAALAALLPEGAVVVDESLTTGRSFWAQTLGSKPHDWLNSMGGSIGFGLPVATGAAIAARGRKVIALEGDGSAMYTVQALWTMAREELDVTIVIFANRAYRILQGELAALGHGTPGERARAMLALDRPELDWVALARGQGVEGGRAEDVDGVARELERGLASGGPYLIELRI